MVHLTPILRLCLLVIFINTFQCSCKKSDTIPDVSRGGKTPIARAGEDQILIIPFSITSRLDGSLSTGDPLDPISSFSWRLIYPSGFSYIISTTATVNIKQEYPGEYLYELMVSSKSGLKAMDTAKVVAKYDSICFLDRKTIPLSLKTIASIATIEDDPLLFKVSDKLALVSNLKVGQSFKTNIALFNLDNGLSVSQILENGRQNMGIGILHDKIYIAGGRSNEVYVGDIDIYDVRTNIWTKESLSKPRSHCTAVSAEGKILFAGGYSGALYYSDRVDIYDPANKTWKMATLSEPRGEIFALYENGKIYFIGGRNASGISSAIDVYDCASGNMINFRLPFNRHGFSSIVYQNKLYIAGGISTTDNENFSTAMDVQILDLSTNAWSYRCLSTPINWGSNTSAMIRNQKIVFPFHPLKWIEDWSEVHYLDIFDPLTGRWEKAPLNLTNVNFLKATAIEGKIYLLAQENYNGPVKLMEAEF